MRIFLDQVGRRAVRFAIDAPRPRGGRRGFGPHGAVVIFGATGTGKTNLSIDLGIRYPSEIVNSDKMQVYRGLDITTNKIPLADRRGVPHHLLGELDPLVGELTPEGFRSLASRRIESIRARRRLPIVAGGSNSFLQALLSDEYSSKDDDPLASRLGYCCCLLWVDVGWDVLVQHLDRRVEEMLGMGMAEELAAHYRPERAARGVYRGLEMAIGVPEFDRLFLRYPPAGGCAGRRKRPGEALAFETAVEEVKEKTRVLARRQVEKIQGLRAEMGWRMRRLDATEAVRRKVEGRRREEVKEAWEREVVGPAVEEVDSFLAAGKEDPPVVAVEA